MKSLTEKRKLSPAILYPVKGLTLHREIFGQRSQGDGEEQAEHTSQEAKSVITSLTTVTEKPLDDKVCNQEKEIFENKSSISCLDEQLADNILASPENTLYKNSSNDKYLPKIEEVALQLTKVSIMSTPDAQLLNTPPKDVSSKISCRLHPKAVRKNPLQVARQNSSYLLSKKRKEPRFIPYEPYKCCVKHIEKRPKNSIIPPTSEIKNCRESDDETIPDAEEDSRKTLQRLNIIVQEFEYERTKWEEERKSLSNNKKLLEDQLDQIKTEKANVETQLKVQSQVNTELKKLLVASVGEDVQDKVNSLTEDKARMATMIRKYSEKVDKDYEEKEKIGIQCDVWRSKCLGSSMLVDELASYKAILQQHLDEAQSALRILMEEHDLTRQHVLNTYKMNKQLREAFDPLAVKSGGVPPLTSGDLVTLAVDGSLLAQTVRDHLCGPLGRSIGCDVSVDGLEFQTPGEKMALQLLSQICGDNNLNKVECGTVSPGSAAMLRRFHPHTRSEHVTVNCCGHCNGEIKVI